ncbi:hypothetical protein CEP51_011250 [Fusarium floridanum]|uniref:Core Histone H2A/H2B/H3 domain-containing protein n=1 Tax=Fusarium floridanum TaxID=1325733 RepID=A0A428RBV1_9HYPO|nr:hypothetical protein CEP51_011250 [Fusarium floridanum]
MPSTPPAQQVPKATTGKRPPTRKRKKIRRSPQPRPRSARFIPPWTMTHPEPLSLRDMRKLRIETGFLIPVSEIARVCQMMLRRMEPGWQVDHFLEFQIKPRALSLLQKEAERFIIKRFTSANNFAERAGRTTVEVWDLQRADELRQMFKQLGISALKALAVPEKF